MSQVFIDNKLNEQFINDGYVILKKKLNIDFNNVYQFFNSLESNVDNKFYSSIWSNNIEYRRLVDAKIKELIAPFCNEYLNEYVPFFSDLLVKKPSINHKLNWHQDWTFIDESKHTPVFFWCPLQDVTKRNGCLMILPKSHQYFNEIRGSNIPSGLDYKKLDAYEKKYAQYIELEKGDVFMFNQSLLHASLPNRSFKNRLALGLYCVPKNIPLLHYHLDVETKKILKYEIDLDFINNFSKNQDFKYSIEQGNMPKPNGNIVEECEFKSFIFTDENYNQYIKSIS